MNNKNEHHNTPVAFDCQNPPLELPEQAPCKIHLPKPKRTYQRKYSYTSIVLIFFIFSFIGWSWEVIFHFLTKGSFVNRGMLFGPWLPIYGFGGTLVLFIPYKISKNPLHTFILVTVVFTIIEYLTSWFFEFTKKIRWWDYSENILNLNGRVCFSASVLFGIGGCLGIYYLSPFLDDMINKIPKKLTTSVCIILLLFFTADMIYSKHYPNAGKGITDYSMPEITVSDFYPNS